MQPICKFVVITSNNHGADSTEAVTVAGNGATGKPDLHTASAESSATVDSAVTAADLHQAGNLQIHIHRIIWDVVSLC